MSSSTSKRPPSPPSPSTTSSSSLDSDDTFNRLAALSSSLLASSKQILSTTLDLQSQVSRFLHSESPARVGSSLNREDLDRKTREADGAKVWAEMNRLEEGVKLVTLAKSRQAVPPTPIPVIPYKPKSEPTPPPFRQIPTPEPQVSPAKAESSKSDAFSRIVPGPPRVRRATM